MVEQSQQELTRQVWQIANHLRGYVREDEFRDYILGLIFYKYCMVEESNLQYKLHIHILKCLYVLWATHKAFIT